MSAPIMPTIKKPGSRRKARRIQGWKKVHKAEAERRRALAREQDRRIREGKALAYELEDS